MPYVSYAPSLERRFWAKVDQQPDGCWLWQGSTSGFGYGRVRRVDGVHAAHRVAWTYVNGLIPPNTLVLHHCDNPPCVRPDHLFLGSHADNAHDRNEKNRSRGQRVVVCRHGHDYTPENTYWSPDRKRGRQCKTCRRLAGKKESK